MSVVKRKKHPLHYSVFQPNILINANTDMKLIETRLYTEILNFNHKDTPDQLVYKVPYEAVTHRTDKDAISRNAKREYMKLTKRFQKRVFDLDEEFMKTHFGEEYPASIVAFPTIRYQDSCFVIEINRYFKAILVKLELGFTKGDIELLRTFIHTYSHRLYWLIRHHQWRPNTNSLRIGLEELKTNLGCAGLYNRFQNFKTRVLEPIQEEFRGTWVEFEYETVRGGRGGAVKEIIFHFSNDFEQTKKLKLGAAFDWEHTLANYNIPSREIIRIRQWVMEQAELKDGYRWNDYYVHAVIKLVRETYVRKNQSKKATPIRNMGAYLYKMLTEGWLIEKVEEMRRAGAEPQTAQLDVFKQFEYQYEPAQPAPRESYRTSYDSFREMYELHKEVHKVDLTEEAYASELGYEIHGDFVIKVRD
ncbi:MAG: RepB family plasmid replication initiator protein [Bacteroidetes bacterium]|nr:MAG: RepB family plasmid replication initiator protein [Bacteroidota bacterium]